MQRKSLNMSDDRFAAGLAVLRRIMIRFAAVIGIAALGGYFAAIPVLRYLRGLTGVTLVAFGIPESFFAVLKIALVIGLMVSAPYGLYLAMHEVKRAFPDFSRRALIGFWISSVLLFFIGVVFCLNVLLPYGVRFLLSFEGPTISAFISVNKFVSFCSLFVIGFGVVFELPLIMVLLGRIGVTTPDPLAGYRRYAFLIIVIVSAILTPSPDILNLILMAVPLYLLYEIGLLGMRFSTPKRASE